jgi:hypothetical protein
MNPGPHKKSSWLANALRFVLPGLVALLLLAAPGHGASSQTSAFGDTPLQGQPEPKMGPGWGPSSSRCPLAPASAFSLQANLRKYLETWPTPGSTATEAWPEYVPEEGEDLD